MQYFVSPTGNLDILCKTLHSLKKKSIDFHFFTLYRHYFIDEIKTHIVPKIKEVRIDNFIRFLETETENEVNYLPYNYKELTMNIQWIIICVSPYSLSIKG